MGSYEKEPLVDISEVYGDWCDQLIQDGFVVLKNVISPQRAQYYLDSLFDWLETFPYGFQKDDKSTWGPANLPAHMKSVLLTAAAAMNVRINLIVNPGVACTTAMQCLTKSSFGRLERESTWPLTIFNTPHLQLSRADKSYRLTGSRE